MLSNLFTTFFEIQIGDPTWMMIGKALNCWFAICWVVRFLDAGIRRWCRTASEEQEVEEKKIQPIGFR